MCNSCFNDDKLNTVTVFSVKCSGHNINIHNVPCLVCKVCGEQFFSNVVSDRLEKIVGDEKIHETSIDSNIDYSSFRD